MLASSLKNLSISKKAPIKSAKFSTRRYAKAAADAPAKAPKAKAAPKATTKAPKVEKVEKVAKETPKRQSKKDMEASKVDPEQTPKKQTISAASATVLNTAALDTSNVNVVDLGKRMEATATAANKLRYYNEGIYLRALAMKLPGSQKSTAAFAQRKKELTELVSSLSGKLAEAEADFKKSAEVFKKIVAEAELVNANILTETEPLISPRLNHVLESNISSQVAVELDTSLFYLQLSNVFSAKLCLPGLAAYFRVQSEEERIHAQILIDYLNHRDGLVRFLPLIPQPLTTTDPVQAFAMALNKERIVYSKLLQLHSAAVTINDSHFLDFLQQKLLTPQIKSIKDASDRLRMLQRASKSELGLLTFDKQLGDLAVKEAKEMGSILTGLANAPPNDGMFNTSISSIFSVDFTADNGPTPPVV